MIVDYSHSNYIPVLDGDTTIWEDYGYLRHTTNLTIFHEILDDTERVIEIFPQTHVKKILESDSLHIGTLLSTLNVHHRHARSINFIGSVLKIIAGTPDADDFENIKVVEKQLVDSNNRQIDINTKTQIQIEKLTNAVNSILTKTKKEQINTVTLFEIVMARNRMIIMELENLILSVTLAKTNIVNPTILDQEDLKFLINNSKYEHYTNFSVSELMEISKVKVISNEYYLYFIIKYPVPIKSCKKITLFPVSHFNKIIQFADTNIVADCGDTTYSLINCQPTLSSTYCKSLQNTSCAQQLVSGKTAHCNTQYNNLKEVAEVDDGIIIINDSTVVVTEENQGTRIINGTYLITFDNNVTINGSLYVNRNNVLMRKPGTPTFPSIVIQDHKEFLSLPMMHELHLKNLRYIGELEKDTKMRPILSGSIVFFIITSLYLAIFLIKRWTKTRAQVNLASVIEAALKKTEDGLHLSEGVVNTK